eukprot:scaffold1112_cov116-Isochrysis_galbana.AAC.9
MTDDRAVNSRTASGGNAARPAHVGPQARPRGGVAARFRAAHPRGCDRVPRVRCVRPGRRGLGGAHPVVRDGRCAARICGCRAHQLPSAGPART